MSENCGIYSITNTVNGNKYIGSAVNISRRWSQHTSRLNSNRHDSPHLQNAWNKYGAEKFEFSVLEYCEAEWLLRWEQTFLDNERPEYNTCPTAGSQLGVKHTEEALVKMRGNTNGTGNAGKTHTDAARLNMSEAHKGKPGNKHTATTRLKMSLAAKGNTNSLGYTHTDAARANMSLAQTGRGPMSEEQKRKLSLAAMGRTVTDATRAQISAAMTGTHPSAEAVLNMCAAQQRSRAKRR